MYYTKNVKYFPLSKFNMRDNPAIHRVIFTALRHYENIALFKSKRSVILGESC